MDPVTFKRLAPRLAEIVGVGAAEDGPAFIAMEAARALYWFCSGSHAGQTSSRYSVLCQLRYRPGPFEGPENAASVDDGTTEGDVARALYDAAGDSEYDADTLADALAHEIRLLSRFAELGPVDLEAGSDDALADRVANACNVPRGMLYALAVTLAQDPVACDAWQELTHRFAVREGDPERFR